MTAKKTIRFEYLGQGTSVTLTEGQCEALRIVGKQMPHWRDGICPRRFLRSASSTSLVRLGLLDARTYPVIGYKPTGRGKAAIGALLAGDEDQQTITVAELRKLVHLAVEGRAYTEEAWTAESVGDDILDRVRDYVKRK